VNQLLLVRHGENRANLTKEFSHRAVDYPLTAKGRLQAEQTAAYLKRYPVTRVFSSPLKRAQETARIIAGALEAPFEVLEAFRETNVGVLEGQVPTEAAWRQHDAIIGAWVAGDAAARFPGGENFLELIERVQRGYTQICEGRDGETVVLVAHGGSLGLPLLELVLGLDHEALRSHPNCAVSELAAAAQDDHLRLELLSWARCDHLSGEAAALVAGVPLPGDLPA
jgi:broad specificity phosphatase PhoE